MKNMIKKAAKLSVFLFVFLALFINKPYPAYADESEENAQQAQSDTDPQEESSQNNSENNTKQDSSTPQTKEDCEELRKQAYNNYPSSEGTYANWVYSRCMKEIGQPITPEPESEPESESEPEPKIKSSCRYFLGMVSWDCNVTILDQNSNIKESDIGSNIWTIVANIATDITVIAAYLVVGYIIYGGYLYIFSTGDTGKTTTGKKVIHQALLGLTIVLSANIILNGIRIALGVDGKFTNCVNEACVDPVIMVTNTLHWVIGISGIVSAIFIVYGGTSYVTSRGDANKVQTAKQTITYALIGMIIVTLAELIVIFASNIINSANANNTAYINTNQIIKEYHEK